MSSIEKGTLKISTVAIIITSACSIVGSYYGTILANQKLRSDFETFKERQNGIDNVQNVYIAQNTSGITAINSYIGTGLRPDEVVIPKRRR